MTDPKLAQNGVLTDPKPFAEYLTFNFKSGDFHHKKAMDALSEILIIEKSIAQKDDQSELTLTTGFSKKAWSLLFPDSEMPKQLEDFKERKEEDRFMPSTQGDIFFMVKSKRMDLNFQVAKYLKYEFEPFCDLVDDVQAFKYLDDRDMIDFVDGTENPKGDERTRFILVDEDPYEGATYLTIQKYIDKEADWNNLKTEDQEAVIGRTKMDDIEIPDKDKKPTAHNVKTKVTVNGEELKMLRQNRPFGNALEHGTMFVGFVGDTFIMNTSLDQMVFADEDGNYDRLLDFVTAKMGANYFVPPKAFMEALGD